MLNEMVKEGCVFKHGDGRLYDRVTYFSYASIDKKKTHGNKRKKKS